MKVLELFAGIGACSKALKRLGIEHEIVDAVEIDKYAIASFNAIHGTNFETQDITKWDKDIEVDLIMHGSPCQDFSVAGKQAGGDIGSGTRSSLMYETIRIVGKLRPKYVVWENVKNLLSKKHKHNFDAYIETMNILGYNSYYQVLNAKDYGIPQNRERVFTISIRKDIDSGYNFPNKETLEKNLQELLENNVEEKYFLSEKGVKYVLKRAGGYVQLIDNNTEIAHCPITALGNINWTGNFVKFEFPPKEELKLRLKDMLEENVDEKYYLNDAQIERIKTTTYNVGKTRIQEKDYCDTLCARDWKDPKCVRIGGMYGQTTRWGLYDDKGIAPTMVAAMGEGGGYIPMVEDTKCVRIGNIYGEDKGTGYAENVWDKEGLSPTLTNMQGGNRQPMIITYNIEQKVQVRKYPVDTEKLVQTLRNAKIETDLTNKEIAEQLEMPQTQIEHYFRQDSSFAIPDSSIWLKLKDILKIKTNEFDESIMTFEEKDGVYEKANRIYDEQGLAPTLTQQEEKILIKNATKKGYDEAVEGDSVNLSYPDSNTRRGRVGHQVSQTIQCNDMIGGVVNNNGLRIRKLTPKECWRLMGFNDEDFEKAKAVPMSNTQLYKQAGNSIVVNVLEKIFKNLFKEN